MKKWLVENWPYHLLLLICILVAIYWRNKALEEKKKSKRFREENRMCNAQLQEQVRRNGLWSRTRELFQAVLQIVLNVAARWWAWLLTHSPASSLP